MKAYPHRYIASAAGGTDGEVKLTSPSLPSMASAPPPEFDGPGGLWSPETLLTAAVADCVILTFRAIARASNFAWLTLECWTEGMLDRVDNATQFTSFTTVARLTIPAEASEQRARRLLEKAERDCLVANSLRSTRTMQIEVTHAQAVQRA